MYLNEEAPLHLAAYNGHNDLLAMMLASGMNVDSYNVYTDKSGFKVTPLHWAVYKNKGEITGSELLVTSMSKGSGPIILTVSTVKFLLTKGADPGLFGKWGRLQGTPIDFARRKKHRELLEILLRNADFRSTKHTDHGDLLSGFPLSTKSDLICLSDFLVYFFLRCVGSWMINFNYYYSSDKSRRKRSDNSSVSVLLDKIQELETRRSALKEELSKINLNLGKCRLDVQRLLGEEDAHLGDDDVSDTESSLPMCPVCLSIPEHQILSCIECDNILCNSCLSRLDTCPICRKGFATSPPKRNTWAEKFVDTYKYLDEKREGE